MTSEQGANAGGFLREIQALKTKAKNRRDAGKYERALRFLEEAAELALGAYESSPVDFAPELSDVYGMTGGILRRQADEAADDELRHEYLHRSRDAYDLGFGYEREELGVVNSYNLVNRLVSRVLDQPATLGGALLQNDEVLPPGALHEELGNACRMVDSQLAKSRRGDAWAMADRALLSLLLSDATTARVAYGPLHSMSPPSYVYDSALSTLRPLTAVASSYRPELAIAVRDLESRLDA
jgi:hypothetical protein